MICFSDFDKYLKYELYKVEINNRVVHEKNK